MRPRIRWSGRDIFTWRLGSDGNTFRCSEAFVARFVKRELRWSKTNEGTQAGKGFLRTLWNNFVSRLTSAITQYSIPTSCCVNSDQTGRTNLSSNWATRVSVVGKEDKRVLTIMVGISMSIVVLPFQAIYADSASSIPDFPALSVKSRHYEELFGRFIARKNFVTGRARITPGFLCGMFLAGAQDSSFNHATLEFNRSSNTQ